MAKEENHTTESNATFRRWEKYKEEREQNFESARQGLYTFFEKALSNENVRQKIDRELTDIRRSGTRPSYQNESGFNMVKDDYDPVVDGVDYSSKE